MAAISHLAVTFTSGQTGSTSLSGGKAAENANPLGAFAGILDALASAATGTATATIGLGDDNSLLAAIAKLVAPGTVVDPGTSGAATPLNAAPATPVDGATPSPTPKLLSDLVGALAALDKDQKAGDKPDPALLKKLNDTLDAIAGMLGLPVQAAPAPVAVATDTGVAAAATEALGAIASVPLPQPGIPWPAIPQPALPAAAATPDTGDTGTPVAPSTQLTELAQKIEQLATGLGKDQQPLADKLDAVAQKLSSGSLSADTMQKLGLDTTGVPPDTSLDAAISALISSRDAAVTANVAPAPQFSTPVLQLPAASVFGVKAVDKPGKAPAGAVASTLSASADKPADTATNTATTTVTATPHAASDPQQKPETPVKVDPQPQAPLAATPDKPADPTPAAVPVATTAPVDQTLAAKTVAAAYQTAPVAVNLPAMAYACPN